MLEPAVALAVGILGVGAARIITSEGEGLALPAVLVGRRRALVRAGLGVAEHTQLCVVATALGVLLHQREGGVAARVIGASRWLGARRVRGATILALAQQRVDCQLVESPLRVGARPVYPGVAGPAACWAGSHVAGWARDGEGCVVDAGMAHGRQRHLLSHVGVRALVRARSLP